MCQNKNYDCELKEGCIWAPNNDNQASHQELELVKRGDIIVHHFDNTIYAISEAISDNEIKAPAAGHPNAGKLGNYVALKYHVLENSVDTKDLKDEKIKYGSYQYGPFETTGKNKEGFYLSELTNELANVFIDRAISKNSSDAYLLNIKNTKLK